MSHLTGSLLCRWQTKLDTVIQTLLNIWVLSSLQGCAGSMCDETRQITMDVPRFQGLNATTSPDQYLMHSRVEELINYIASTSQSSQNYKGYYQVPLTPEAQ